MWIATVSGGKIVSLTPSQVGKRPLPNQFPLSYDEFVLLRVAKEINSSDLFSNLRMLVDQIESKFNGVKNEAS